MTITAATVKTLRERTGAGMMECKKALTETGGDIDAAIELLRKKGAASAEKKAGRIAAEGVISSFTSEDGRQAVLAEVNCETDFVAKDASFQGFARAIAACVAKQNPADVEALMNLPLTDSGESVDEVRRNLIGKIGENITIRRFENMQAGKGNRLSVYLHGVRIGTAVESSGGRDDLGRDLAMHVAASRPQFVDADAVPPEVIKKEKEIYTAQAQDSGKPQNIIEKMVSGRVNKFLKENTLLGQPFVKDEDQTVEKLLKAENAKVTRFVRFEVGEGLEKRSDDFVAEVMAQAGT